MIRIYAEENSPEAAYIKGLLEGKSIQYTECIIGKDCTKEFLREQYPTLSTFPIIIVDGFNIGGAKNLAAFLRLSDDLTETCRLLQEDVH